jgi:hypothetical protein
VHRYHPEGERLWLRDTANADTELQIDFVRRPPDVTEADLRERPLTPEHIDMPLVYLLAAHYYALHPKDNDGKSDYYRGLAWHLIEEVAVKPKTHENRNRRDAVTQWGYKMW